MGIFGGGSSKSKNTTNTVAEPWEASQPLLKDLIAATGSAFGSGQFDIDPYSGRRIARQSGTTRQSLEMFGDIAGQDDPFLGGAAGGFENLLNFGQAPDFLGDPYNNLSTLKENALGEIMPAAMRPFSGAGMLDSTLAADAAGRAATQAIAPFDYGAWNQQQDRLLSSWGQQQSRELQGLQSAVGMAPGLSQARYIDPQMLAMAGGVQDSYAQSKIDARMAKYYEGQNQPYDELQRAASLALGFGGMGGSKTTTGTQPGGGALGAVGGAFQTLSPLVALSLMK